MVVNKNKPYPWPHGACSFLGKTYESSNYRNKCEIAMRSAEDKKTRSTYYGSVEQGDLTSGGVGAVLVVGQGSLH